MASGGNNISDINNSPPQEAYVLYGAVVGGPDKHDRFFDIREDWPETEVFSEPTWNTKVDSRVACPRLQRTHVDFSGYPRSERHFRPILYLITSWDIPETFRNAV